MGFFGRFRRNVGFVTKKDRAYLKIKSPNQTHISPNKHTPSPPMSRRATPTRAIASPSMRKSNSTPKKRIPPPKPPKPIRVIASPSTPKKRIPPPKPPKPIHVSASPSMRKSTSTLKKKSTPSIPIRVITPSSTSTHGKHAPLGIQYYYVEGLGCTNSDKEWLFNFFEKINEDNYICHNKESAPIRAIVNSITKHTPMKRSNYMNRFLARVLNDAEEKNVYVYGHSYGGAIVNRLAEELERINDPKLLGRIFIAGFGSIYLAKLPKQSNVNLINYIAIGDVVNSTTWGIEHKQRVTDLSGYDVLFIENKKTVICKYKKRENHNIFDVCLYRFQPINEPTCMDRILSVPIIRAKQEWDIHNSYLELIKYLMNKKTNNIEIANSV